MERSTFLDIFKLLHFECDEKRNAQTLNMKEFCDLFCDFFTRLHRFDDRFAAMGKITTDEDIAFSLRADEFIFGLLTHGKDDRVGGEFHRRGAIHRFERYRFDAVATIDLDRLERRNHGNAQAQGCRRNTMPFLSGLD